MNDIAYDKMAEFESDHFWFLGRKKICLSLIDKIIRNNPINRILDYGCGTGDFLVELQKAYNDKEIYGADISEKSFEYCHNKGLHNIFDLTKADPPTDYFDLIICLDVLEHISEDTEFLLKIRSLLKNNGILLVAVPAYDFLWSGEDYVSCHIRRYTQKTLKKRLLEAKFQLAKISYFNIFLFLPLLMVLIGNRIFHPKKMYESDIYKMNYFLNKILTKIFTFEKELLKFISFPFGASIIAIAKKMDSSDVRD